MHHFECRVTSDFRYPRLQGRVVEINLQCPCYCQCKGTNQRHLTTIVDDGESLNEFRRKYDRDARDIVRELEFNIVRRIDYRRGYRQKPNFQNAVMGFNPLVGALRKQKEPLCRALP